MTKQKKVSERHPFDERISQVSQMRLAVCGILAIPYILYRIIHAWFSGENAVPELVLLTMMTAATALVERINNVYSMPTMIGRQLNPAPSARGKRITVYLFDAAVIAAAITLLDYFCNFIGWSSSLTGALLLFALAALLTFLFNIVWGEHKVKQYNKYQAKLEAEENDLS